MTQNHQSEYLLESLWLMDKKREQDSFLVHQSHLHHREILVKNIQFYPSVSNSGRYTRLWRATLAQW